MHNICETEGISKYAELFLDQRNEKTFFMRHSSTLISHMAEGMRWREYHIHRRNRFLRPSALNNSIHNFCYLKLSIICKKSRKIKSSSEEKLFCDQAGQLGEKTNTLSNKVAEG